MVKFASQVTAAAMVEMAEGAAVDTRVQVVLQSAAVRCSVRLVDVEIAHRRRLASVRAEFCRIFQAKYRCLRWCVGQGACCASSLADSPFA